MGMTKSTEIDERIAENVRAARLLSGMTQPQVAAHLGIAYQSYQKMEKPGHSFRVSTLNKLSVLYGVSLNSFVDGTGFGKIPPSLTRVWSQFLGLDEDKRQKVMEIILEEKYKD